MIKLVRQNPLKKQEKIISTNIRIINGRPQTLTEQEESELRLKCEENYRQQILESKFRDNSNSFFMVKVL